MAVAVPYIWMIGTFIFSAGLFLGGLRGEPRRTNMGLTYLNPASPSYRPDWWITTHIGAVGGCIMGLAILVYFIVLVRSLAGSRSPGLEHEPFFIPVSELYHDEKVSVLENFSPWITAAVLLIVIAYYPPIRDIVKSNVKLAPGYGPDSPVAIEKMQ